MATKHPRVGDNLTPMSNLSDYKIEKGDPDPRGWTVRAADGQSLGKVEDLLVDTSAMKVRYLVVDRGTSDSGYTDSGPSPPGRATGARTILLNVDDVDVRTDAGDVYARRFTSATQDYTAAGASAYDRTAASGREQTTGRDRLTRSEEELHVDKHEVSRGEARVGKHVETEHVRQPVTTRREEVVVERRPVESGRNRGDATFGDDEVRIPLTEEEVTVEKRPVVKEELVIGKRTVEERDVVETDVRREKFDIDTPEGSHRDPDRTTGRRDR